MNGSAKSALSKGAEVADSIAPGTPGPAQLPRVREAARRPPAKRRTGRGRNARTTTTTYSIALDPTGTTSATRKAVGRRTQALTPEEVQEVVARERAARGAAVRALPRAQ